MVSGKSSKAVRNARAAVVTQKSTPWGLIAAIMAVVLFAGGVFGYAFLQSQASQSRADALAPFTPTAEKQDPSTTIEGVTVIPFEGGQHVQPAQTVAYTTSPPMGGTHDGSWAACNGVVYPEPVRSENLVHSLEHGAVWIAYNPDQVTGDALQVLRDKVQDKPYSVMSPFPGLDQPISLQSWGHQLKVADAADVRIDQFVQALRRNQYTHPEVGASCLATPQFNQDSPPPFAAPPAESAIDNITVLPEVVAGAAGVAPDAGS